MRLRISVSLFLALLVAACASSRPRTEVSTRTATPASGVFIGADVSALAVHEKYGAVYQLHGRRDDALHILTQSGFNCFRLRLFVAPNHEETVTNDLAYTLALARRIKASGAQFMLDIHYSDTWADPSKQFKPAAWAGLPLDQLVQTVRTYTQTTLARFAAENLTPDYVQIGNEITGGLLWPEGRVEYRPELSAEEAKQSWSTLARLLSAGIEGVKTACAGTVQPKIILHIESTGQPARSVYFFQQANLAGLHYDIAALSYYPEWHGNIAQLRATLAAVAAAVPQPILVVETAYPAAPHTDLAGKPNLTWPLTPAGQRQFLQDVLAATRELPDQRGLGVCYWYPESTLSPGFHVWYAGTCALFDEHGEARPAISFSR